VRTNDANRLDPALLKLAAILTVGGIAPFLDATIVAVAVDRLGRELHASVATIQWVSTGYLLTLAMAIPVSGWAVRHFGAKRMWLIALAVFLAGSVLCGLAWSAGSLIAFRVLQGVGGGLLAPILQTLLVRAAGPGRVGRIITVITLVAVVVPILGPVVGGLIISATSWRWIFYVNVPLCVAGLVLAWRGLPADTSRERGRLDVTGLALLCPAMAAIVYGLSSAGTHGGFASPAVLVPLVAGTLLLAGFVWHALRGSTRPLLDVRLFRVRSLAASSALLFLSGLSLYGAMLLLPLYYQQVRGQTALAAGLLLAPQGIGSLLTRWAGGLTDRIGARPIVLGGLVLTILGTLPYAMADQHTSTALLAGALVVRGAGLGAATLAIVAGTYQGLAPERIPDASGITRIVQQLGGSFGTAALAVVLQRGLATTGRAGAFDTAFWWVLGASVLALVPALLLPGGRRRTPPTGRPPSGSRSVARRRRSRR
jgi:EmrB/QacA subfamily drug resistance transporter